MSSYTQLPLVEQKRCTRCGETKFLTEYAPDRRASDGRCSGCRACATKWKRDHPEWVKAYHEKRKLTEREKLRAWERGRDREKKNAKNRRYKERNREKMSAQQRDYYRRHPEKVIQAVEMRRARIAGAEVSDFTRADWERIKVLWNFQCAYCGCTPDLLTKDHVVPLARGGNHTASNIVPACHRCNSGKKDKLLSEWSGTPSDWPEVCRVLEGIY